MITVQLETEVIEMLESIAAREVVEPADIVIRAFAPMLGLEPLVLERMQEVEKVADIDPGTLLDSYVSGFDGMMNDAGELFAYLREGWRLTSPEAEIRENLQALVARWVQEDAAAEASLPERTAEERAADERRLAEIIEEDKPANEQAEQLRLEQAGKREITLWLDADLLAKAEAYFPHTEHGSVSGFVEAALLKLGDQAAEGEQS